MDELLTTAAAAERLGICELTMKRWRIVGETPDGCTPPPYIHVTGGKRGIRYVRSELEAWIQSRPRYTANTGIPARTSR